MPPHTNRLARETSPYLLQHSHNPVDWYPWGEEALRKAKEENKPILVSIGYSACHWCHVMEKESFENEETAALMNDHFVNIKIDREERPDLDHIYMDAVQAMTGGGGWPLNVFLTPEGKPFFGGTYFPPQRAFNRPSWRELLLAISANFQQKREEIDEQAENLIRHLTRADSFGIQISDHHSVVFSREKVDEIFQNIMKSADKVGGGFGKAPKFPQTFLIQFLLRYHYLTQNKEALDHACLTLDKMIYGGIYDQIGGGFARYSTDEEWGVPHFEKMLYDNALLISVLSEAYQLTRKDQYREVIEETMAFVQREMMHPDKGFYSALDADSEGEEGKFYIWSFEKVKQLLGNEAVIFCEFFGVTQKGNWEGKNILHVKKPIETFAREKGITEEYLRSRIREWKSILLAERNHIVRPALDDKIILSWNALMNISCSKAYAATGKNEYRELAIRNMDFLLEHFKDGKQDYYHHTWKNNEGRNYAFLDDYAFLIQALLQLQEVTGSFKWIFLARDLTEQVNKYFLEEQTGFFFYTDSRQNDVILRKKEVYDGATPSANAAMAYNIHHLSVIFDRPGWKTNCETMLASFESVIMRYPASFGFWSCLLMEMIYGTEEIAIVGENSWPLGEEVLAEYIPHKLLMVSAKPTVDLPLLAGKSPSNPPLIYLCRGYSCLNPVTGVRQLLELIYTGNKN